MRQSGIFLSLVFTAADVNYFNGETSLSIYLPIFLYVLTPEGDIRRVPGNQVLGVSLLLLFFCVCVFFLSVLCNVSSVSSE